MDKITINSRHISDVTVVSNTFIDKYMPVANGAYVKVYLYLLRCLSSHSDNLTVSSIADSLDDTETDIMRALSYWEKVNLISVQRTADNGISGITLNSLEDYVVIDKPHRNFKTISPTLVSVTRNPHNEIQDAISKITPTADIRDNKDLHFIISIAEKYLQRLITPNDEQLILYLYTKAGFSCDMILELYEYCASQGKMHYQYIEKVASTWIKDGVDSVDKIKDSIDSFNANYKAVVKEFGISRTLGQAEKDYIDKWIKSYSFSTDIIKEACSRTILTIQKPDFKYADRILSVWYQKNVRSVSDIMKLDENHVKSAPAGNVQPFRPAQNNNSKKLTTNKFNSFSQRDYTSEDFNELERRLLSR